MNKVAICLLAYGYEHINECNELIGKLHTYSNVLDFIVATDDINSISPLANVVIKITEPFNYNQKIIPIEHALEYYNNILFMDVDMIVDTTIDFSILNNVEEGIYPIWYGTKQKHLEGIPISIYSILKSKSKFADVNEYGKVINEIVDTSDNVFLMDEFLFFIKSTNTIQKKSFINQWKSLHLKTFDVSPFDRYGNRRGSLEGILISLSASKSNLKIKSNTKVDNLFNSFTHHVSFEKIKPNLKKESII
jgi:hypothetical protein